MPVFINGLACFSLSPDFCQPSTDKVFGSTETISRKQNFSSGLVDTDNRHRSHQNSFDNNSFFVWQLTYPLPLPEPKFALQEMGHSFLRTDTAEHK